MDDVAPDRPVWWDRPELVEASAALAVGVVFAVRGLPLAAVSGVTEMMVGAPVRAVAPACALLALSVVAAALRPRSPGWPVALAGLALLLVADQLPGGGGAGLVPPTGGYAPGQVAAALVAVVGAGLALGGALLAVAQAPRAVRWLPAGGLAAGLVLHPVISAAVQNALPDRYTGSSVPAEVQLWLAVPVALFAALLAHRRAIDLPRPAPGRAQVGPVAVAAVAGALTLAGLADRSWLVRTFRLSPDGLAGHRRTQVVEALSHYSLVVIAAVVALVLIGYAYRVGRAAAARWVVLGAGAGPVLLHGFPLETATSAQRAYLVTVTGAAALTAGALLARHAAGLLPWDAIGLLVAAAATALASPVVRSELPSAATVHPVLVTLGLGLALGFGVVLVAAPGPDEDTGRLVGLLALGPAALVLSALALAPVVLRSQMDTPYREPMLTVPVFAAGAAGLLVLLFGFQRAVDRIRRDLRAEAARAGESA